MTKPKEKLYVIDGIPVDTAGGVTEAEARAFVEEVLKQAPVENEEDKENDEEDTDDNS